MHLAQINIYPIKSTRQIRLDSAKVEARGLQWDRRWMLIDQDGKFITARQQPRLATVDTQISGDSLLISADGQAQITLPLISAQDSTTRVQIWRDQCDAAATSEQANEWFTRYLGIDCRLVHQPAQSHRGVNLEYGDATDEVSFADGFPLLLISQASLTDLNRKLSSNVPMRRFRPNVVIDDCDAFAEDDWNRLRIGDIEFRAVKRCSRCIFTTIDPLTGIKDADGEPLRTLSQYRRGKGGVFFGQNLIPAGSGTLQIGDSIKILA
ncbi:MAG TPA: MOSC domain-containing protein [Chromatiales bacterium]|jgi:uncharacterized protein YcbX|nr:MOSC domain-containing protein [Chromatiaceae bacterium]HIB84774.1 MOSC domain-containing protein [Chromatiaceae bacterium]HIN81834.1 MOSC domain-containing protein [Chromatiales bacterium]HIO15171.1 MOSC domain-containing protein [Chromatiales bacterium]HIO53581.1 MOSC domain-containing protein [Chromatiales bacterium]